MMVFPIRRLRQREQVLNEKQTMLRKDCAVDSTTMNDKEEELLESAKKATVTTTMNTNSRDSFFTYKKNQEDQLNSTKHQIDEAKEENERLKTILSKIMRDYQSLQIHFQGIVQHEKLHKSKNISRTIEEEDEVELVSLSLGRNVGDIKQLRDQKEYENECKDKKHSGKFDGLELGLECRSFSPDHFSEDMKIYSPENSFEESKKEDTIEPCIIQNPSSKMAWGDDEDFQQQNPLKKARVSIRAVCDTTTMNDGCQWRKYGQKIAKGNPCPRAYYRCTVSPSCPVRKQVQRCFEDMSILTTTYEGTHNHPLPVSATAMASTTSAAASMLRCTSSSSTSQHNDNYSYFSFNTSNNTTTNNLATRPPTFHLPKTSISTSQSHPTITLDFTNHVPSSSSSSNTHRLFSSSSLFSSHRYNSSTSLNFSPSAPTSSSNSYTSLCNNFKSQMGADSYLGRPCFSQPFISKNTHNMTVAEDNVTHGI